jgi:hypothetical protein
MAKTSKSTGTIIIIALVALLFVALNPSTDDFKAWRSSQAESQATGGDTAGIVGALKSGAGKLAGAISGAVAGGYERRNYYLFSTYSLGSDRYLGVAHLFIKVK